MKIASFSSLSALYSGEESDPEISGVVGDSRLTTAAAAADGDDEHDSLEGNGFGTDASSPTGNASTSSCSGSEILQFIIHLM